MNRECECFKSFSSLSRFHVNRTCRCSMDPVIAKDHSMTTCWCSDYFGNFFFSEMSTQCVDPSTPLHNIYLKRIKNRESKRMQSNFCTSHFTAYFGNVCEEYSCRHTDDAEIHFPLRQQCSPLLTVFFFTKSDKEKPVNKLQWSSGGDVPRRYVFFAKWV